MNRNVDLKNSLNQCIVAYLTRKDTLAHEVYFEFGGRTNTINEEPAYKLKSAGYDVFNGQGIWWNNNKNRK